ncbi:MAG: capsule polysaccharide biosynthesis protein [Rickettsiaceae bacterium]|jgi:hypothetical protein|nr:capsule polysaccharide biosynthesis protein [Rickettsiaceae bacterium]
MNIYFYLGHTFFDYSIGIAREVKMRYPDAKFSGIVAARSNLIRDINKAGIIDHYEWLSGLEKKWLAQPLDYNRLAYYEKKLGTDALRRMVTSDRELGVGFVTCGIVEKTDLMVEGLKDDEAKWRYAVGILDYFYSTFEQQKPDIVFVYSVSGAIEFAMAIVAQDLGIKFIQPAFTRIEGKYVIDDDMLTRLPHIKELYNRAMQDSGLVKPYRGEAKSYIDNFRNKPESPEYSKIILNNLKRKTTITGLCKTIAIDLARWGAILLGLEGTKGVLRQRYGSEILKINLRCFWYGRRFLKQNIVEVEELSKGRPYIYFPLHVDPEASTMVLADKFTNQIAVIETIAKSMPAGMRLLVKEHVPCIGKRPKGFYEQIERMPDVELVSPFLSTFQLLKNAALAVTITGTVGWEALILQKPFMIIGEAHYKNIGAGFVHCSNTSRFVHAIAEALEAPAASNEQLETYVACLIKESVPLSPNELWYNYEKTDAEKLESIRAIVDKCEELLKPEVNKLAA